MRNGERQVSPTLSGIRADHTNRYKWAIDNLPRGTVIDAACGIGYGSWMLANAGFYVRSIDIDAEAIEYGNHHYNHDNVHRQCCDLYKANLSTDPVIAFECIEHVEDPLPILKNCNDFLICSVPNEDIFPYKNYAFHYRHYTKQEFEQLLNEAGYEVVSWHGQLGPESEVEPNVDGRTLIAMAKR